MRYDWETLHMDCRKNVFSIENMKGELIFDAKVRIKVDFASEH